LEGESFAFPFGDVSQDEDVEKRLALDGNGRANGEICGSTKNCDRTARKAQNIVEFALKIALLQRPFWL
jgi:hypothetical protein